MGRRDRYPSEYCHLRNLDKTHLIGQIDNAEKQKKIVKFTSDSFRETAYKNQKEKLKKLTAGKKNKQKINNNFMSELNFSHRSLNDA